MVSVVSPWKNDGQLLLLPLQLQVSAIWLLLHFPYCLCADAAFAFAIGVCLWAAKVSEERWSDQTREPIALSTTGTLNSKEHHDVHSGYSGSQSKRPMFGSTIFWTKAHLFRFVMDIHGHPFKASWNDSTRLELRRATDCWIPMMWRDRGNAWPAQPRWSLVGVFLGLGSMIGTRAIGLDCFGSCGKEWSFDSQKIEWLYVEVTSGLKLCSMHHVSHPLSDTLRSHSIVTRAEGRWMCALCTKVMILNGVSNLVFSTVGFLIAPWQMWLGKQPPFLLLGYSATTDGNH